jgi:uncharacterized protein
MSSVANGWPDALHPSAHQNRALGTPALAQFDIKIDPWGIEYGSETPTEFEADADDDAVVDAGIERDAADWSPIIPNPVAAPEELAFVDGVRRLEARLVVTRAERVLHGALGAYSVGVVRCRLRGRTATFGECVRERLAIFGSNERLNAPIAVSPCLIYAPLSVPETDPDAPLRGLQREMRAREEQFARQLAEDVNLLVITDGPLSVGDATPGRVIGFIKRLFKLYLDSQHLRVLRALPPGARTPLFVIGGATRRFPRISWFTRLAGRLSVESDFTGLVRLEVSATIGRDEAIRLADMTASLLPRFVPSRSRDPRAPQNLIPIGALEQHLRRELGDARLVHRRVATRLARESVHV